MTDERLGDSLLPSIAALPWGSGIVFRHYSLEKKVRRSLFDAISRVARRRQHLLVIGGTAMTVPVWLSAGRHGRAGGALSAPVHSRREAIAAQRTGAALLFISPVFETRSHPGAAVLGRVKFGLITRNLNTPVIALGGMTKARARSLKVMKIYGWAAISALAVKN
jgi:thiamine-phosphate pyrophosphorylase